MENISTNRDQPGNSKARQDIGTRENQDLTETSPTIDTLTQKNMIARSQADKLEARLMTSPFA